MTHNRQGVERARNRAGAERKAGRAALHLWGQMVEGADAVRAWAEMRAAGLTEADAVSALRERGQA